MQDANAGVSSLQPRIPDTNAKPDKEGEVVSTHVLVAEDQVEKLRELSRRTRVAQSEYLREAVDDLLAKYQKKLQGTEQ